MTGDLSNIPPYVSVLFLAYPGSTSPSGNHFSGGLVLYQPSRVYINYQWITDVVFYDTSRLVVCDLSDNPSLGNPNIANLTMCTKIRLYNASSLPNTMLSNLQSTLYRTATSTSGGIVASLTTTESGPTFFGRTPNYQTIDLSNLERQIRVLLSGMFIAVVLARTPFKRTKDKSTTIV